MFKNKDINNFRAGENICLFKKGGLLPITCGKLEYFDDKHDEVCVNIDKRSVKLTKHLYDFVSTSALNKLGQESLSGLVRQQFMQFSSIIKT